jgi:hypothetical protein
MKEEVPELPFLQAALMASSRWWSCPQRQPAKAARDGRPPANEEPALGGLRLGVVVLVAFDFGRSRG